MNFSVSIIKPSILALVILTYGFIGYYPINPLPEFSNENVLKSGDELRFLAAGIAYTETTPEWLDKAIDQSYLEILLDVQSTSVNQRGPARILTVSENTGFRNITVGQQGGDLVVRLRRSEATFNGTPPFIVPNVFDDLSRHKVHVLVQAGAITIAVNGSDRLTSVLPDNAFASWSREYRLALGNEITFDRPWLGVIRQALIRVNSGQVDYLASGALSIPETYYFRSIPRAAHIIPFYRDGYSSLVLWDRVVNFVGFVPLGFFFIMFYPGWSTISRVTIVCFCVSLFIETMQIFLPWRHPSIDDLILNTLGGAIGSWVGFKYQKRQGKRRPIE